MNATSSRSAGVALRSRTWQPWLFAPNCSRASASTHTASGSIPATSTKATARALAEQRAHARAQPGQVVARDRAVDRERDRLRCWGFHRNEDRSQARKLIARHAIEGR